MNWYKLSAKGTRGYWIKPDGQVISVPENETHGNFHKEIGINPAHTGWDRWWQEVGNKGFIRVVIDSQGRAIDIYVKPTPQQIDTIFKIFTPRNYLPVFINHNNEKQEYDSFEEFYNAVMSI